MTAAGEDAADADAREVGKSPWPWGETESLELTREAVVRGLGFIYAVAFLVCVNQFRSLVGADGLLPASRFLGFVRERLGPSAYVELPTLFWLSSKDWAFALAAWTGLALSLWVLVGRANAVVLAALWALYTSFVSAGQVFYAYGWELLLLESGFLAVFYVGRRAPPSVIVTWLFRWLVFRVMFGAGLIKLRGDPCWVELTCLVDHYQTQPNPGPLSPYFHALPVAFQKGGVLVNHVVELVMPWFLFGPRRFRIAAGLSIVFFQVTLILSGNLSFLNWLTIVVALSAFDDAAFLRIAPRPVRDRLADWVTRRNASPAASKRRVIAVRGLAVVVGFLSLFPVVNMISPEQRMNGSFDPFHLVNTYGAFGSIEHERHEVILEGTWDDAASPDARWQEYEFPCKPGDVRRRPCLVTPYHYRLDWQMWFAGLSSVRREPWIVKLVYELLRGNETVLRLLAKNPFSSRPPRFVRAVLYRYEFAHGSPPGAVWRRERVSEYLRPLSLGDPDLAEFLAARGW
ncbi:MAG TPA: lipase maturation factor family protein [Polyangiaceae bacterium]|nr:lipase maturation factor family protein [Polyangiaceae bacterium]